MTEPIARYIIAETKYLAKYLEGRGLAISAEGYDEISKEAVGVTVCVARIERAFNDGLPAMQVYQSAAECLHRAKQSLNL